MTNMVVLLSFITYTLGILFYIKSFFKFKEYIKSKGEVRIKSSVILISIGSFLLALPTFFSITTY